ncbi:MAG: nucleoside recognition domain-containing protein, partial [Candidatus Hinthialibacter sp.]
VLEDCGYLPRAAYLMDRLLSFCGLSGKSFIPLLSSFACAVPGVMAARTIEDRNDRLTTILVAPLMSCSARLPVYMIFIAAFIPNRPVFGSWINLQGLTLFAMYLLGVVVSIPVAWILKRWLSHGRESSFLLEMPTYKWPSIHNVLFYVYDRVKSFIIRAGTLIFFITVIVWALAYFPRPASIHEQYESLRAQASSSEEILRLNNRENGDYIRQSILGRMGQAVEPVVEPLGWDWRIGMATLASFPAREIVVAVLGAVFNLGGEQGEDSQALRATLQTVRKEDGTPLFNIAVALSIMVYFALCCQCGATLAAIKRETNSWGWASFTFIYMTILAYGAAFLTYQIGCKIGLG